MYACCAFKSNQVKNSFISLLIDVQNRQKEHRELLRKKKKIRSTTTTGPNGQRAASTHIPGTVSHAPQQLQTRTKVSRVDAFLHSRSTDDQTGCVHGGAASRVRGEPSPSFLFVMPPHLSLLSSSPYFLLLPRSCSLWRDSPMSFKMASVKLLATQQGTNRCPLLFLSTHIPFFLWQHVFFPPLITAVTGDWFPFFHLFQSVCSLVLFLYRSLLLHHQIFILVFILILFNLLLFFFIFPVHLSLYCMSY